MIFFHKLLATLILTIISFMVFSGTASAEWPENKPITMIMPYGTGGTGDIVGRLIARSLQTELNVPTVFENKPGGNGNIGRSIVARADPNGHTLLIMEMSFTMQAKLNQNLSYDTKKSFQPIGIAASSPHILVVSNSVPANSIHELISLVKSQPGKFNFGSGGVGGNTHLGGELFKSVANVDIVHVPYKGSGLVIPDLIAGRVQILVSTVATLLPYIQSGQVKPLVVLSTDKRLELLPNVPTVTEENLSEMKMPGFWVGLAAPAGTSKNIVDRLNYAMNASMSTSTVKSYMLERGLILEITTPEQATEQVNREVDWWSTFIQDKNIKIEE
jgi:tripartite-type tricarboxylate transporter receptor subunit TctC